MVVSLRPFATAGIALAATGALAVVPSGSSMLASAPAASPMIQLAASTVSVDPVDPWTVDAVTAWRGVFNNTQVNWAAIVDSWNSAPAPVLQQMIVNWLGYFADIPDFVKIIQDFDANVSAATTAIFAENDDAVDGPHGILVPLLQGAVPEELLPVVNFLTTYSSGIWMGMLGTTLSPLLALRDATEDIVGYLGDAEWHNALNVFVNIPAIMTDAYFNGYGEIDLTSLVADLVPAGITLEYFKIAMGGLLSPAGPLINATDAKVHVPFIGNITIPGLKVGPLASWIAQGKVQAEAIGWSGEGNPLAPTAPSEDAEVDETTPEAPAEEEAPVAEAVAEDEAPAEEAADEEVAAEEAAEEAEAVSEETADEAGTEEAGTEVTGTEEAGTEETGTEPSTTDGDAGNDSETGSGEGEGEGDAA